MLDSVLTLTPLGWYTYCESKPRLQRRQHTQRLCTSSFFSFYNCIVPLGFLLWESWVAVPGESQLWKSHATQPMVHAECFSVSIISQTLTWTTESISVRTNVNACNCTWGCTDTCKRVCTERWLWERNLLLYQGTKSASAASLSDALPTELCTYPLTKQLFFRDFVLFFFPFA